MKRKEPNVMELLCGTHKAQPYSLQELISALIHELRLTFEPKHPGDLQLTNLRLSKLTKGEQLVFGLIGLPEGHMMTETLDWLCSNHGPARKRPVQFRVERIPETHFNPAQGLQIYWYVLVVETTRKPLEIRETMRQLADISNYLHRNVFPYPIEPRWLVASEDVATSPQAAGSKSVPAMTVV